VVYKLSTTDQKELATFTSRKTNAEKQLKAAIEHTIKPSATNGGLQTGSSSYEVEYIGLPTVTALVGLLQDSKNKLTVSYKLSDFSSADSNLSINGGPPFRTSLDVISIQIGEGASEDLQCYSELTSQVDIKVEYPGITIVQAQPKPLSADLKTGWYDDNILWEVVNKTGKDLTGFQLQGSQLSVDELFGPSNRFAVVKSFVISDTPTIQLTFHDADSYAVKSRFQENVAVKVQLAGIFTFGSTSGEFQVTKVDTRRTETVVSLGPPKGEGTIPAQEQTAYIIGGVIDYPLNKYCIHLDCIDGRFNLAPKTKISQVKVTIHTGNVDYAGTDANVCFKINNGDWWILDKPRSNDFERNQTDTYGPFDTDNLTVENISRVPVELKHDNTGIGPGWYVEWLRLEACVEGIGWIAYKQWQPGWLADDESDRTIYRKLQ
jgi:hypothetical protein